MLFCEYISLLTVNVVIRTLTRLIQILDRDVAATLKQDNKVIQLKCSGN